MANLIIRRSHYFEEVCKKSGEYNENPQRPDYPNFAYCINCQRKKPIEMIRCDECHRMVRRRSPQKKFDGFEGY